MNLNRVAMAALLIAGIGTGAENTGPAPKVFGVAKVEEVYRIVLDRDALLLESITDVIKEKGIQDGQVLITAGSTQECTYHFVKDTAARSNNVNKVLKGPHEILGGGGIIANGEPHIHISLAGPGKPAYGGHLEKGCKILYLGEVTILKYSGQALTRKENANGISLLTEK